MPEPPIATVMAREAYPIRRSTRSAPRPSCHFLHHFQHLSLPLHDKIGKKTVTLDVSPSQARLVFVDVRLRERAKRIFVALALGVALDPAGVPRIDILRARHRYAGFPASPATNPASQDWRSILGLLSGNPRYFPARFRFLAYRRGTFKITATNPQTKQAEHQPGHLLDRLQEACGRKLEGGGRFRSLAQGAKRNEGGLLQVADTV